MPNRITLRVRPEILAICRLASGDSIPAWAYQGGFVSITRADDELSIICVDEDVPFETAADRGWMCLTAEGPFDLDSVGVVASLSAPLAASGVPVLTVGTFDTDHLLVRANQIEQAIESLRTAGHRVDTTEWRIP